MATTHLTRWFAAWADYARTSACLAHRSAGAPMLDELPAVVRRRLRRWVDEHPDALRLVVQHRPGVGYVCPAGDYVMFDGERVTVTRVTPTVPADWPVELTVGGASWH